MDSLQLRIVHWVWQTGGLKLIHKLVHGLKHNGYHKWKWKSQDKIKFTTSLFLPIDLCCSCITTESQRGSAWLCEIRVDVRKRHGYNLEKPAYPGAELSCTAFKLSCFASHKLRWKWGKHSGNILIHFPPVYFLNQSQYGTNGLS